MTDINAILAERGKTHGPYREHAAVTQNLKAAMVNSTQWEHLDGHERETLEMIAHKMGRILSGSPHYEDHWRDIAGYATLSADLNLKRLT